MANDEPKKEECKKGAPAWMCTFADLSTLLMCFFVLLLSFSVMDVIKFKQVAGSVKDAFGVQTTERYIGSIKGTEMISKDFPTTPLAVRIVHRLNEVIAQELANGTVEVEEGKDSVLLRMKDAVVFNFGESKIREEFKPVLDKIGKIIAEIDAKVVVNGHTDNVPVKPGGEVSSNWSLSAARSVAVIEYWTDKFDIPSHRLSAVAYADGQPLASNDTAEGRAENRRVEFKIQLRQTALTFKGLQELLIQEQKQ